ncbi:MAG: hypothetical protein OHK0046_14260 [Anaerolineae bacterium]
MEDKNTMEDNMPMPPQDGTSPVGGSASNGDAQAHDNVLPRHTPPAKDEFEERLERLGGEPAPVITPEEFARLQKAGQVHIDSRGRVRTSRRTSSADAGVSLRKRRAWY